MFWLGFVYPRSHPRWIGPIGEFAVYRFIRKQAYRYFIPFSSDLHSIWSTRLAFLMPFRTSRIGWHGFCMFWLSFIYPGPIPAELGQLAKLKNLNLRNNILTGNHPFFSWLAFNMNKKACFPYALSYQSDRVTWFLYELTEFCIPQVPFRLNWANWRIYRICIYT
jgi:hypothetical protein